MKKQKNRLLTFAVLLAIATIVIHIINRIIASSASLKDMLDINSKNYYKWRFGKIYYTKKGKGTPILLIHDMMPGASGYEWSKIERQLALKHTVYTIDLLGCGRSDKPGMTYTNFVYVQMICDFIKNVIGGKTDVIASGFSASFVTMACHNEKECFNKIMFVNPPSMKKLSHMPTRRNKVSKVLLELPVLGTMIYHIIVSRENTNNLFIEKLYFNPFHMDQDVLDAYYEGAHRGGCYAKCAYASYSANYMNINITHGLKAIDNSIYIIEGEAENNGNNVVKDYQNINPSIEAVSIKKTKHFPHLENPEEFLNQVGIFF